MKKSTVIIFAASAVLTLASCSKSGNADLPNPSQETTQPSQSVNMTGIWRNVSHTSISPTGTVRTFQAKPDEFFNFINSEKLAFSTGYLSSSDNAVYQIANNMITIRYKLYGGSTDGGGQVVVVPYTYIFPLEFDENGLWVISWEDGAGNKAVLKYKKQ